MPSKEPIADKLMHDQALKENRCRTCGEKLESRPFAGNGKIRCTNCRCLDCCNKKCNHPANL